MSRLLVCLAAAAVMRYSALAHQITRRESGVGVEDVPSKSKEHVTKLPSGAMTETNSESQTLDLEGKCGQPELTEPRKWNAMASMAGVLNSLNAPWNIHGGTLLGLARSCSIFDYDIDIAVERQWMHDNHDKLEAAISSAGFVPLALAQMNGSTLGNVSNNGGGYEEKFLKLPPAERAAKYLNMVETFNRWELIHPDLDVRLDLFAIERSDDQYAWDLWTGEKFNKKLKAWEGDKFTKQHTCHVKSTGTKSFSWLGVNVMIPVPVEDALISQYGKGYIAPAPWVWNVQPFSVGNCKATK